MTKTTDVSEKNNEINREGYTNLHTRKLQLDRWAADVREASEVSDNGEWNQTANSKQETFI
jgi:hypothetical protein